MRLVELRLLSPRLVADGVPRHDRSIGGGWGFGVRDWGLCRDARQEVEATSDDFACDDQGGGDVQEAGGGVKGADAGGAPGHQGGRDGYQQAEDDADPEKQRVSREERLRST